MTCVKVIKVIRQASPSPGAIRVVTPGPPGPQGEQGPPGQSELAALTDVDVSGKTAKSLLYYDAASGKWIGDSIQTIIEVTDGGNF